METKFGERAFSYAGPSPWNELSEDLDYAPWQTQRSSEKS